jgi:hypothetical protein
LSDTKIGTGNWFQKNPKKSILLVYIGFAALFLLADFVLSNINKSCLDIELYQTEHPIGHVHKSDQEFYYGVKFWKPYKNKIQINNLGFRGNLPFNNDTINGKDVVFTVGDSATAALEVALENSYPYVLGKKIGNKYIVFNAGVRAYDTNQVIIQYVNKLRFLNPKKIIYMIYPNDLSQNINAHPFQKEYYTYFGRGMLSDNYEIQYIKPSRKNLSFKDLGKWKFKVNFNLTSYLITRIVTAFLSQPNPRAMVKINTDAALNKMKSLLKHFDMTTAKDNVKLYITFFPGFTQNPEKAVSSEEYLAYKEIKRFVESDLNNSSFIPIVDVLLEEYQTIPDKPRFTFKRDQHANEYGNREIGRVIAEYLLSYDEK